MDQTRWLIVFSVIVCMSVTLALLQKFAGSPPDAIVEPVIASEGPTVVVATPQSADKKSVVAVSPASIKYPAPPAHIFAVSNEAEAGQEAKTFSDKGKINP